MAQNIRFKKSINRINIALNKLLKNLKKMTEDKNNQLAKAIYSTVAYFDIFDYPLTLSEIWQNLYFENVAKKNFLISDALNELENNEKLKRQIEAKNGFYFFSGRGRIIEKRLRRYDSAQKKYKIALKISRIFRFIPFIKAIFICNSLAFSNSRGDSDIDFFIVCRKKRIWLARFLTVSIIKILNRRPETNDTKDKICLSFFISDEALNLAPLAYKEDIYLKYWICQICPIYDSKKNSEKIHQENQWLKDSLPNQSYQYPNFRRKLKPLRFNIFGFLNLPLFNFLESLAKIFQQKILPDNLKKIANSDGRVIINDQTLKFHPNDRRLEYRELFLKKAALFE